VTKVVLLSLTGPFAIRVGKFRQKLHIAGNTKRLLILLAANFNHGLRRESIIAEIWPDADARRGASSLNTAISRLKNCLDPFPDLEIDTIDDVVRMTVSSPALVDGALLQQAVQGTEPSEVELSDSSRSAVASAIGLCNGQFLEGCDEHWVLPMRERYSALYIRALLILMRDAAARGEFERALECGREVLELDPFREGTQREVMWLYVLNGQRAQALRQYAVLRRLLREDLDIEPMAETVRLYSRIKENDAAAVNSRDRIRPMNDRTRSGDQFVQV